MPEQATILGKRILVAEDDAAVRESLKLLLSIDRHTVIEAKNGSEALALFTAERFDLVILDYVMPEMRGYELALNIKRIAPSQPVLMVTAYYEQLIGTDLPVDGVISKPFGVTELREAIAKLAG